MKLTVFGLSISSSWGNGHATLWRGLVCAPHRDALRACRSGGPPARRPARPLPGRPVPYRNLCRGPAARAEGAVCRTRPPHAGAPLRDRRRPVSPGLPLDAQPPFRPPPGAGGASRLPRLVAADAERDPRSHGVDGLVPVRPPVRGDGLWRARAHRRLGGAGRLLRARAGDPGGARHRRDRGRHRPVGCRAGPDRRAARERTLAEHTADRRVGDLFAALDACFTPTADIQPPGS
jgi:hypothetical protein